MNKFTGKEAIKALCIDAKVHRVLEVQVDDYATKKDEGLRINKPLKMFTPDTITINEVKKVKVSEGIDAIIVNGGKTPVGGAPLSFNPKQKFPGQPTEISTANGASVWTDDYELAYNHCTLGNNAELARVDAMLEDLNNQRDMIIKVQKNNDAAYKAFVQANIE